MTDTGVAVGVKENNITGAAVINSAETGTVIDGLAMQMESDGTVKIYAGARYCGIARIIRGDSDGNATAVAGDTIALVHWGVQLLYDSEDDALEVGQAVKPTGTAGKFRNWVSGVDGAELLAGYLERTKDADKKILVRLVGGR